MKNLTAITRRSFVDTQDDITDDIRKNKKGESRGRSLWRG